MDKEIADQFNQIAEKRRVLEHLQSFIKQLHTMIAIMEPVQQILKPSQKPSRQAQKVLNQLMEPFTAYPADQLKRSLTALDKEVELSLGFILNVADDSVDGYSTRMSKLHHNDFVSAHEMLLNKMRDFRRKAQTDVAVRLTLHKRGVLEHAGKLPISQDTLNEKVSRIRSQEVQCKRKIIDKAREIIKDINTIANNDACPPELKEALVSFKGQVKDNLQRLKEGKSIDIMPAIFEEMSIEAPTSMAPYPPPLEAPSTEERVAETDSNIQPPSEPEHRQLKWTPLSRHRF